MGFSVEMIHPEGPSFRCETCGTLAHWLESIRHDAGGRTHPNRRIFEVECEHCKTKAYATMTREKEETPWSVSFAG